jgi:hypothetical protein
MRGWLSGRAHRNGASGSYLLLRILFAGVCCSCISGWAVAESIPDSVARIQSISSTMVAHPVTLSLPAQRNPGLLDDALYASIASYRTLDYFSTRRALAGGAHELILPEWVVDNRGRFIAFEALASGAEIGGSMWLIRHGHRHMARATNIISIGLGVRAVVNNYTEPLLPIGDRR